MSIDRRLREELRASADAVTPDPLVGLHIVERKARRQRRRTLIVRLAAVAAAIALVLFGLPWSVIQLRGPVTGSPAATPPTAATSAFLPEGTYGTPELTREQLIDTAVQAGFTRAQAEQALTLERIKHTATFTLTLQHGEWKQSFSYDGTRDGVGFEGTYKVINDSTVMVTEPAGYQTEFEYALQGDPSESVSRTPIQYKCAKPTPSARWASWSGKARRSAGSSWRLHYGSLTDASPGLRWSHRERARPCEP